MDFNKEISVDDLCWIAGPRRKNVSRPRPAVCFRGTFEAVTPVQSASLTFTALGLAEPWLNGERVANDYFTPGWSDYRKRAYLCRYDVTSRIHAGENCLGFILADGWAGAPYGPKGHAASHAPQTMLAALLTVCYADGRTALFSTGSHWHWRLSEIIDQSLYHGEFVDARKSLPAPWSAPDIQLRGWKPVREVSSPAVVLAAKKCPPVRVTQRLKPKAIWQKPDGGWLVDFGQNMAGVAELCIIRPRFGQRIKLRFAEMLDSGGDLYTKNLRNAKATDQYICRGDDMEVFSPRFTCHGFRYLSIEGLKHPLKAEHIQALVLHNDLEPIGRFSCSSGKVNKLQQCIRWGQRSNFIEAPTDCPQRDERLGWTGDAQVFVNTACFNYDCEGFYRQWMDAMRDGQRSDGAFPDVAPDILGWHGNAGWADAGIIVPHAVWLHTGSKAMLAENWAAMEAYMRFLRKRAKRYIQPETVYGDWLAVDAMEPQHGPTPKDLIGTAYYARDAELMALMATALGKTKRALVYKNLARRITAAFQRRFVSPDGLVLGDTQTSYLLALAFHLLPPTLRKSAHKRLIERIAARDWHLSTGFLGTPLLNPVLSEIGHGNIAYRLLFQDTYPSWLHPLKHGATTMWERWDSWTPGRGFGPVEMNSFNHYAYGAIGEWLYQRVGGIAPHPDYPGYLRAVIHPIPGDGITHASTSLKSRVGHFQVGWKKTRNMFAIKLTIPRSAEAQVILPTRRWQSVVINKKKVPTSWKLTAKREEGDLCQLLLTGGIYGICVSDYYK